MQMGVVYLDGGRVGHHDLFGLVHKQFIGRTLDGPRHGRRAAVRAVHRPTVVGLVLVACDAGLAVSFQRILQLNQSTQPLG